VSLSNINLYELLKIFN